MTMINLEFLRLVLVIVQEFYLANHETWPTPSQIRARLSR